MAVPKYRKSKSKTMMRRRQNDKLTLPTASKCPECGAYKQSHRVCPNCGMYKGRTIIRKD